jgi:hypothetical protein
VPYAMLLYERFLGRPFAGHRDLVSELIGDIVESAVEVVLSKVGVSYRKTKCSERVSGFDQAPDFFVPDEFNPVLIQAKLTEDDCTARDKVAACNGCERCAMRAGEPMTWWLASRGGASRSVATICVACCRRPTAGCSRWKVSSTYTLVVRDRSPEHWVWDSNWGETVFWIPAPFRPIPVESRYNLMPRPQKVQPLDGRFVVTTLVVLDQKALAKLDPRGPDPVPAALNENETAKFLTEAKRLAGGQNPPIVLATNEYRVASPA